MRQSRLDGPHSFMNYALPKGSSDYKTTHGKSADRSDVPTDEQQALGTRKYDYAESESLEQNSQTSLLTELDTLQEYIEIHEAEYDECVDEFEKEERLR